MADLSPEEANQWFGGQAPTNADIASDRDRMQNDPLGYWWSLLTGGQDTIGGRSAAAMGHGDNPIRSPNEASALAQSFNLARDVRNAPEMDAIFRAGAAAGPRANPYSTTIADQSRPAQLALMEQMRQQMSGPSISGLQGQRAMGAVGQQALMQGGRAGMLGAQNAGVGLAGDLGQARLAEIMRAQAGIGGAAGNLRAGDLRSADAQMSSALQQRQLDDRLRQFYLSQGSALGNARDQAVANREITRLQALARANQRDQQMVQNFGQQAASVWDGAAMGGKPPSDKPPGGK